jgi:hypothetical protein
VTPFHHQPEAQHPKSSSYPQGAGRLPHLLGVKRASGFNDVMSASDPKRTLTTIAPAPFGLPV